MWLWIWFVCILVWFFLCVCVRSVCVLGGILPVEVGSCLQSGSQQSPDLWPSHSRTTTNRLRLLFFKGEPLLHLSWLHLSSFSHTSFTGLTPPTHTHLSILCPCGHASQPSFQSDNELISRCWATWLESMSMNSYHLSSFLCSPP